MTVTDEPAIAALPSRRARSRALTWFWPHGAALTVIAALAAAAYAWRMGNDPLEPYYEASVRSMSTSAHDFLYGAFDPAGTLTLDKLPGALWVQALFVVVFGFHTWAMVLPQTIEGVLAVVFLYRAVARLGGRTAGVVAAAVLAASPAVVALNRGNMGDTLMMLLLVLAADATSAAVKSAITAFSILERPSAASRSVAGSARAATSAPASNPQGAPPTRPICSRAAPVPRSTARPPRA